MFLTVDSNNYVYLVKILGIGYYADTWKDVVALRNTTYINATSVENSLSGISDGAVSMRFDISP